MQSVHHKTNCFVCAPEFFCASINLVKFPELFCQEGTLLISTDPDSKKASLRGTRPHPWYKFICQIDKRHVFAYNAKLYSFSGFSA